MECDGRYDRKYNLCSVMDILIVLLLLLVNGLFSMYEMALVSSSKARLETMLASGNKRAGSAIKQLSEPEKMLSMIQVGITLIGIVSGAFSGVALSDDFRPLLDSVPFLEPYADKLSVVVVVGAITYLSLIVGELVPKSLALKNPEKITVALSPFMALLSKVVYPLVWSLTFSVNLINKLLGIKDDKPRPMSHEELKYILHNSSEQGVIAHQQTQMLKGVFRFGDKRADELMTHRKDLVVLYTDSTKQEVLDTIAREHYSKYVLCCEELDNVQGVVSVKDIILMAYSDGGFDLTSIAHCPTYIPEGLDAGRIVELFKRDKSKFGVVVSEYGSVEGIVTLHDLSESIFGDIPEDDEPSHDYIVQRADGSYLVDGLINIDDFMDAMGVVVYNDIEALSCNTLGGMAMSMLARVPLEGDRFKYRDLLFEIVDMDGSRVDKLLVEKNIEK